MSDQITTTETRSWGSRLKGAAMGVIFGPILVIVGCILLWTNEGRSARMIEALSEGRESVVTLDVGSLQDQYNGSLVHMTGEVSSSGALQDPNTRLSVSALALERKVEMYQWREKSSESTQNNMGGSQTTTTTYTYEKVWDTARIDSSEFSNPSGHTNPTSWKYDSTRFNAQKASLGLFDFSDRIIARISADTPVRIADTSIATQTGEVLIGESLYVGRDPAQPEIGDLRVTYLMAPSPSTLSIIAKQSGSMLTEYEAKSGSDITRVSSGTHSADEMFAAMEGENTLLTWGLRALGSFLIFIGASWFLSIVPMLAMVLPFLGGLVGFGTNLIALLFAVLLSGLTIVIAWFAYRPIVSLVAIVLTLLISGGIWQMIRTQKSNNTTPISS